MQSDHLSLARVRALLDEFQDVELLLVGDLMLDVYLHGPVERISPEGPVPIIDVRSRESRLGGAANVALNIAALGGRPQLLGVLGDDEPGRELLRLLAESGIATGSIVIDPTRPTTVKTRVMGDGQQICRYDQEKRHPLSGETLERLRERALSLMPRARGLLLSDYGKGVLLEELVVDLARAAHEQGVAVVVDPKEGHFSAYRGVDLVTPNKVEAGASFGSPIRDDDSLEAAGRGLLERLDVSALMITLGERGIALFEQGRELRIFPAKARQVFDVTGAGDMVVSVLAMGLATGGDLAEGAQLANHAAGIVVGRIGTSAVLPDEVIAACMDEVLGEPLLGADGLLKSAGLVLRRDAAAAWAAKQRDAGRRVVFTNGCFDILHFGHHALLSEAAHQGDMLLVGINSDDSVRRLKGEARPVNGLPERAGLLAQLRSVDAVVPFEEDTPLELIRETKPDVLVKGDEYSEEAIVGAADVKTWGGRVHRFPMQQGYSTTLLLEKQNRRPETGRESGGES